MRQSNSVSMVVLDMRGDMFSLLHDANQLFMIRLSKVKIQDIMKFPAMSQSKRLLFIES